ncbi:hypothetical protein N7532_000390 [Penicillium argentinense]|uniref:RNA methyltransferase n=1 Tax=Penicillium argentinense TaxID=1131581 RepID=A0A9W9G556_9EURO|nr:uncharacterized protein N7532_000390 [Penicillium argentinense]KAJ5112345.1 hypothetical protein N7532_000390 [Penicillium argentinense]
MTITLQQNSLEQSASKLRTSTRAMETTTNITRSSGRPMSRMKPFHSSIRVPPQRASHGPRLQRGKLTNEAIAQCGTAAAVGVDIDQWLVEQAKAAYPDGPCTFEHFGFLDASAYKGTALGKFDVVLLLSVTKWLHLNNGDAGIVTLFAHIQSILNEEGYLVEPQPMSNCARASKRNKELRETYKTLQIKPSFDDELKAQGFERILEFKRDEEGFARPVHVWRKKHHNMINGDGFK